ncbi:MAG: DUF1501 domain-containing protein, partial [Planctomycetaceae bacterium]
MLSITGGWRRTCEGLTRRTLLQAGGTGLMGLSLPTVWQAQARGATSDRVAPAKSVIFLLLFGGPS